MIILKGGFELDFNNSTDKVISVNNGSLFDNNAKLSHQISDKQIVKLPNTSKYYYFNIKNREFVLLDNEISPVLLDSTYSSYYPFYYIKIDANYNIINLVKLQYEEVAILPPDNEDLSNILNFKIRYFANEQANIVNNKILVQKKIVSIINIYIQDKGDLILNDISFADNTITINDNISGSCQVTYVYSEI